MEDKYVRRFWHGISEIYRISYDTNSDSTENVDANMDENADAADTDPAFLLESAATLLDSDPEANRSAAKVCLKVRRELWRRQRLMRQAW
ncbi:MAG: hypothetical protein LUG56_08490 [Lachnospiraceae bacterium]|nr:hypothetical protein [Lachnospiraceae bacterium]